MYNLGHTWRTKLNETTTDQQEEMGMKRGEKHAATDSQRVYRYVRYTYGTILNSCHGGATLLFVGNTPYVVTQDVSDTNPILFAGIANTIMANNEYGWIQCGGLCESIITDGALNAVGAMMPSTTDGVMTSLVGAGENNAVGVAMSADTGTVSNFVQLFDR